MPEDGRVLVGRVVKPHGIRGELVVEATGETLATIDVGSTLWIDGAGSRRLTAARAHQGRWLLVLEGCDDRDAAEALRGAAVQVQASMLAPPSPHEWYADDLPGWRLQTPDGRALGRVSSVIPGAAHDYLETDAGHLVPMVKEWLVRVDAGDRLLVIDLPAGLLAVEVDG